MQEKGIDWGDKWNVIQNEDLGRQVNELRNENAYLKRHLGDKSLTPIQALRMLYGTGPESTPTSTRMNENDRFLLCKTVPALRHESRPQDAANCSDQDGPFPFRNGKSARRSLGGDLNLASDADTASPLQERILQDIGNRNPEMTLSPPKILPKQDEMGYLEEQVENTQVVETEEELAEGTSLSQPIARLDSLECLTLSENFYSYNRSEEEITSRETFYNDMANSRHLLLKGQMMFRLTYLLLGFLALAGSILIFFWHPHEVSTVGSSANTSCKENSVDVTNWWGDNMVAELGNVKHRWGTLKEMQDSQESVVSKQAKGPQKYEEEEANIDIILPISTEQPHVQVNGGSQVEKLPYPCFSTAGLYLEAENMLWLPTTTNSWIVTACAASMLWWAYIRQQHSKKKNIGRCGQFQEGRNTVANSRQSHDSDWSGDGSNSPVEEDLYPDVIPDTGTYSVLRKSVVHDHVTVTPLRRSARLTPASRPGLSRYSLADVFDDVRTPPSYLAFDVEQNAATLGKTPRRSRRLAEKYYRNNHLAS
eukprot:CAMPEP_0183826892 /NCGR_PEP_ID=MMETSP0807_2-20130328/1933_1 /TAXON_ID=88271 /ORGANISM="Picocystis salinarum, Strain CCMP1897" /LENGTH=536 /DNA_ID=CAMNT_0026072023 /DNA_START=218 /DNA_END=1828 /DNA_ORIENTATION=+